MAAIDKMCMYSGEYVGHDMYKHSRNHIQIKPQYRKTFVGKDHAVVFFEMREPLYVEDYCLYLSRSDQMLKSYQNRGRWKGPGYYRWGRPVVGFHYPSRKMNVKRIDNEMFSNDVRYYMVVYVPDNPNYDGEVYYYNIVENVTDTRRRLARMFKKPVNYTVCRYDKKTFNFELAEDTAKQLYDIRIHWDKEKGVRYE